MYMCICVHTPHMYTDTHMYTTSMYVQHDLECVGMCCSLHLLIVTVKGSMQHDEKVVLKL